MERPDDADKRPAAAAADPETPSNLSNKRSAIAADPETPSNLSNKRSATVADPENRLLPADGLNNNGKAIIMIVELLIEILSWLPASSLSRFRFVSNHWHSLITNDPSFRDLHIQRGFNSSSPSILIRSDHGRFTLMDNQGRHKHLVYSTEDPLEGISSSCNGLVCIYRHNGVVVLFNPTTREELVLPKTEVQPFSKFFIGYLPRTNEYKVVRFFGMPTRCEVLTIGTSTWRQITINSGFGCGTRVANMIDGGVGINGIMYWITGSWGADTEEILSFDLNEEKFRIVQFPWILGADNFLLEMEGQVCVALVRTELLEIWVLEDVIRHTWIKRYTPWFPETFGQPILFHQGKLLIRSNEGLNYRDLKTGFINFGSIYNDEKWFRYGAQPHIESLVSLKALCC